ncbi:hypothetical protein GEV33_006819 [Tenebrio molitor]|uniref:DUF5641 domain-containing protein n=1 Tax=Tenebrio molitor TaxID=7067 RepID=A0A8J6HKF0_TENMO|nr:hypothetical protein GEV33_006819 [Tenebrio molitor]
MIQRVKSLLSYNPFLFITFDLRVNHWSFELDLSAKKSKPTKIHSRASSAAVDRNTSKSNRHPEKVRSRRRNPQDNVQGRSSSITSEPITSLANTSISRLKARQQILEGIRREFEETQYEFETLDSKCQEMKTAHRESRIAFENKYCDVMADMMDIINSASNPETKTVPASVSDIPLNLPVINLGTFSGNYKNWTNFENSFKSVIHENKGLNNRQRLQYLKSCLREEALRAIESLPIEDENYEKAWEILENRFKNTRLIVQDHVTSILNAPTMNKQSRTALRELLDTLTSNIAALKMLKIQVESWDALIIPIITEKLDYNTKKDWQTFLDTKVPTYGQFINFLEKRCTVLESLNSISNKSSNQAQSSNTSFQKSTQPSKMRIEACLNSRPLTPLTSDPNDLEVLTPFHFLIGETHTTFPEQDWSEAPTNRLSRWQLIEKIRAHFWKRWNREYLTSLQNRQKLYKEAPTAADLEGATTVGVVMGREWSHSEAVVLKICSLSLSAAIMRWKSGKPAFAVEKSSQFQHGNIEPECLDTEENHVQRINQGSRFSGSSVSEEIPPLPTWTSSSSSKSNVRNRSKNPSAPQLKSRLTLLHNKYISTNAYKAESLSILNNRIAGVKSLWQEFVEAQTQIEDLSDDQDIELEERDEFDTKILNLLDVFESEISLWSSGSVPVERQPSAPLSNNFHSIPLPKIDLPEFTGKFEDWLPFYEVFKPLIHENPSLDDTQRLLYLKSCLKGEAKQVVVSLKTISENYEVAWESLREKFENKRILVQNHVNALLFSLELVPKNSPSAIGSLLEAVTSHTKALKVLDQPATTIPQLELCTALLLAKLYVKVRNSIKLNIDGTYFWTDSTIVLDWLAAETMNERIFVANRISEISTLTNPDHWHHVAGVENPADAISRGLSPTELVKSISWRHVPNWLNQETWKEGLVKCKRDSRPLITLTVTEMEEWPILSNRRGNVTTMYSDNGTNFVGANKELQTLKQLFKDSQFQQELFSESLKYNTNWKFIPANSPHWGGLWEAGIKSVKGHIKRVVGDTSLTFEEMYTFLTQVEACVNSRPITQLSTDPNDLIPLTPGHFLIGDRLTTVLEPDLTPIRLNRLSRWQLVQQLQQHFWRRWSSEYLHHLQQRSKWQDKTDKLFKADTIYTDFAKAFDRIDHRLIISKLDMFGIVTVRIVSVARVGCVRNDKTERGTGKEAFLMDSGFDLQSSRRYVQYFQQPFCDHVLYKMTDLAHLCTMLPEIAAQIIALNNDGRSVRYIAQHLKIPRSTVQDALSRFRETHGFTRRPDLIIAGQQLIEMTVFCVFLYCEIGDCHQLSLLDDQLMRLKERGLSAKTPATGPRLTVGHRRARLEFAHQYVNWSDNEWKNVLFTDKSRFNPRSPDDCEKIITGLDHGLLTTGIYKGQKSVTASRCGIHTSCESIKILYSPEMHKFVWLPSTAATLHTDAVGKHLVEALIKKK